MDYLKILLSSFVSITAMFVSTKIIGNKQMSQLNMFDYINGITIGSIAAELAIDLDRNPLFPLIGIGVYTLVIFVIGVISNKNMTARRFFTGKSIILMNNGKLYYKNFKTAKVDLNEFLTQCRINGFFNPQDIETAVLEQNGMLSFMPRSVSRPATPKDLSITPSVEHPFYCIIADGKILEKNLTQSRLDIDKLMFLLKQQNTELKDVFGAFYDGDKLLVYPRIEDNNSNDMWQ